MHTKDEHLCTMGQSRTAGKNIINWGKGSGSLVSPSIEGGLFNTNSNLHLAPDTISKCKQRVTAPFVPTCKKKKNGRREVGLLRGGSWRPVASCSQGGRWPGGGQAAPRTQVKKPEITSSFNFSTFFAFQFTTRWQPGLHPPAQGWVSHLEA